MGEAVLGLPVLSNSDKKPPMCVAVVFIIVKNWTQPTSVHQLIKKP